MAVLVGVPILGVAVLWALTPSVAGAAQLVRTHLSGFHSSELVVLPQPDRVGQALIATEDSRFWQTPGIDPVSTLPHWSSSSRRTSTTLRTTGFCPR